MAGAKTTFEKAKGQFKDVLKHPAKGLDPVKMGKMGIDQTIGVFTPDVPVPEEETIIPIPDENSAALAARKRRASKASTGRSSTILTEGLGG